MLMQWKKTDNSGRIFKRKRPVIAALGAVLLIAFLFNTASTVYRQRVEASARLLRWVDFNVTAEAMRDALQYDVESHGTEHEIHWIDHLACLGARYGSDFSHYKREHMEAIVSRLGKGESIDRLTADMKF